MFTLLSLRYTYRHAPYSTKIVIKLFGHRVMAADVGFYGYSCAAKYCTTKSLITRDITVTPLIREQIPVTKAT